MLKEDIVEPAQAENIRQISSSLGIICPSRYVTRDQKLFIRYIAKSTLVTVVLKRQLSDAGLSAPLSCNGLCIAGRNNPYT